MCQVQPAFYQQRHFSIAILMHGIVSRTAINTGWKTPQCFIQAKDTSRHRLPKPVILFVICPATTMYILVSSQRYCPAVQEILVTNILLSQSGEPEECTDITVTNVHTQAINIILQLPSDFTPAPHIRTRIPYTEILIIWASTNQNVPVGKSFASHTYGYLNHFIQTDNILQPTCRYLFAGIAAKKPLIRSITKTPPDKIYSSLSRISLLQ